MVKIDEFKTVETLIERLYDPKEYDPGTIYLVENNSFACFLCPCGCGQITTIIFIPHGERSGWNYKLDKSKITINPSILFQKIQGCGSHYFIRDNKVQWC